MLNDPINGIDPRGTDTTGVGVTVAGSFLGASGSASAQIVVDDKGGTAIAVTKCGGVATPNVGVSAGATVSSTNASTVGDLGGKSTSGYVSAGDGLGATYSHSQSPGSNSCPKGVSGGDVTVGGTVGVLPGEAGLSNCVTTIYHL